MIVDGRGALGSEYCLLTACLLKGTSICIKECI